MKTTVISFSLFALCAALGAGCGGSAPAASTTPADHHAANAEPAANTVAPGVATIGDTTTCPVTGETFVVTETSPSAVYEGKTYYFCCPGCDERFLANPAQYLEPAPAS